MAEPVLRTSTSVSAPHKQSKLVEQNTLRCEDNAGHPPSFIEASLTMSEDEEDNPAILTPVSTLKVHPDAPPDLVYDVSDTEHTIMCTPHARGVNVGHTEARTTSPKHLVGPRRSLHAFSALTGLIESRCPHHRRRTMDLSYPYFSSAAHVGDDSGNWFMHAILDYNMHEHAAILVDADTGQLNLSRQCTCQQP